MCKPGRREKGVVVAGRHRWSLSSGVSGRGEQTFLNTSRVQQSVGGQICG